MSYSNDRVQAALEELRKELAREEALHAPATFAVEEKENIAECVMVVRGIATLLGVQRSGNSPRSVVVRLDAIEALNDRIVKLEAHIKEHERVLKEVDHDVNGYDVIQDHGGRKGILERLDKLEQANATAVHNDRNAKAAAALATVMVTMDETLADDEEDGERHG